MKGTATLVAIGLFTCLALDLPDQDEPWSMLRYGEVEQRWKPLANNLPSDMVNVRGYGSAVLDNYLFIVGGYRMTSQEISAAHCYNPCRNEWNQVAPLNQKRSVQVSYMNRSLCSLSQS
jgi:N-acetylneuraminic acid mutarotase